MRFHRRKSLLILFACVVAAKPAARAADPDTANGVAYFETHIRPLLVEHCYKCHSSSSAKREGGLLLDSRTGWSVGGDTGPAILPGDADASLLIQAVRYSEDLQMPPDKALSQDAVARLERWVMMGAPDPRDKKSGAQAPRIEDPSDPIAGRQHWAFRPLAGPRLPAVEARDWPWSSIDTFVLARLEEANLRPAPDADRRTLVRRLYFQLSGLPPTPSQVTAFLEDRRPDAYERLVDRLLDSPHFGERWGRHWLDLARYADSNGLDENFLFREAWRYRRWVIDALNADTSFDRFVVEQLAGDLLPYDSVEQRDRQRTAAGFLVVGPKVLLGNDDKKQRMEVADEQLDTIGRAILGQTLGCARCHDHKFDPIPTADYYALAGILTSTRVMEQRYMLGQQRVMERLVGLGERGGDLDEAYEQFWRDRPKMNEKRNRAKTALELLKKSEPNAIAAFAEKHADAFADGAADAGQAIEKRVEVQQQWVAQLEAALARPPEIPPRAMIPCDVDTPSDDHIRLAGQFDRLGPRVPRGFLRVLGDTVIEIPDGQSGRMQLGFWLTDAHHGAGQLAARVLANRVWHHLIGRGIVTTVDNFGRTGQPPSHAELLDHLAGELLDAGWSIKDLVRKIVLSRTFAMSSRHDDAGHSLDPENGLLWRAHRRRLQPEALRDAMLSAAGQLDLSPMDSSVWYLGDQATAVGDNKVRRRTDFACRSVYLPVIRNDLPELFEVFDFADPHATTGARPRTTVATQGLFILNDNMVMDAAEATARRLLSEDPTADDAVRLDRMFELILNIQPTDEQRNELLAYVRQTERRLSDDGEAEPVVRAWSMACHATFSLSRFQFLE